MKVLILTTKTNHHFYFLHKLFLEKKIILHSIFEKKKINFSFKTKHKYENIRDNHEKLELKKEKFRDCVIKNSTSFNDINSDDCIDYIKKLNPKIIISYGVSKIKKKFLKNFGKKTFNLHGGNPEYYRGLDSFLWAIYHKDFNNFYVTLHKVLLTFDSGKIIFKKKLILNKTINIYNLRLFSTKVCLELVKKIIRVFINKNKVFTKSQNKNGRYYSAMPSALKDVCITNFNKYIKNKYGN